MTLEGKYFTPKIINPKRDHLKKVCHSGIKDWPSKLNVYDATKYISLSFFCNKV